MDDFIKPIHTISFGIDQSLTCTGLFYFIENNQTKNATCGMKSIKTKKSDQPLDKLHRIRHIADETVRYVMDVTESFPFAHVVVNIEGLGFGAKGDATHDLAGLQYLIMSNLIEAGFDYINIVPPTSLKKIATGNGNASKEMMIEAILEPCKTEILKKGTQKERSDLADAYHLARLGLGYGHDD